MATSFGKAVDRPLKWDKGRVRSVPNKGTIVPNMGTRGTKTELLSGEVFGPPVMVGRVSIIQ